MMCGGTPADAAVTMRARGVSPCCFTAASLATTIAAAPSDSCDDERAVTMPPAGKTVRSLPSRSSVVSGRGPSSWLTVPLSVSTGRISASNRPSFCAATARSLERSAKVSESSRVIPSSSATSSAVSPIGSVALPPSMSLNLGLVNRQPRELSTTSPGRAHGVPGLAITQGARVIDSTPPAMTTSACPVSTACAADTIACNPLAHSRLTVNPGVVSGRPASSAAIRATLRLSSPAWLAAPKTTSSIASGATPARETASATTSAARSSGRMPASAPPYLPMGVRTPPIRYAVMRPLSPIDLSSREGSAAGDQGGGDRRDSLAATGQAQPVRRRRSDRHGRPDGCRHRGRSLAAARRELRLVADHLDGDVADGPTFRSQRPHCLGEQPRAGRVGPARVVHAEHRAEVTEPGSAQQRVAGGVRYNVAIRMAGQPLFAVPLQAGERECPPVRRERMYVDTDAHPWQVRQPFRQRHDVPLRHAPAAVPGCLRPPKDPPAT